MIFSWILIGVVLPEAILHADDEFNQPADDIVPELKVSGSKSNDAQLAIETKRGAIFLFPTRPASSANQEIFAQLSEEQKQKFHQKRQHALTRLASILSFTQLTIGSGAYIKERLYRLFNKGQAEDALKPLVNAEEAESIKAAKKPLSFTEHRHAAIQSILTMIDEQIWGHAPLVANSNQFGFLVFAGVNGGVHIWKTGFHAGTGIGMSVAYNHDSKAVVYEIFQDIERIRKAFPVVVLAEVYGKVMIQFSNLDTAQAPAVRAGRAIYPPGPILAVDTPTSFAVGLSPGVGFPPLGLFYAYENAIASVPWLRVIVSPLLPGMIRVKLGTTSVATAVIQPVNYFAGQVLEKTLGLAKKGCQFISEMAINGLFKFHY